MASGTMKLQNLQALRGLAALGVVAAHIGDPNGFEISWLAGGRLWTGPAHAPGQAGVDLFFVISGLIMMVTTSKLLPSGANAKRFVMRRLTRIYPAYWVATLPILALFLVSPSMVNSSAEHPPRIFESLFLLPQPGLPLLLVGWTLTFELYFYVIFTATLFAPPNLRLPLLGVWGVVTAALAVAVGGGDNPWVRLISAPICLEFIFGAVVGWLIVRRQFVAPEFCTAFGLVSVTIALWHAGADFPGDWYRAVPVGLLIAVLVYGVIGLEARRQIVAPAWMRYLGDASYSIYLWHVLILTALGRFFLIHLPGSSPIIHAGALAFSVAAVLTGSIIAYRLIEQPLIKILHDRLVGKRPAEPLAAGDGLRSAPAFQPAGAGTGYAAPVGYGRFGNDYAQANDYGRAEDHAQPNGYDPEAAGSDGYAYSNGYGSAQSDDHGRHQPAGADQAQPSRFGQPQPTGYGQPQPSSFGSAPSSGFGQSPPSGHGSAPTYGQPSYQQQPLAAPGPYEPNGWGPPPGTRPGRGRHRAKG